MWKVAKRQSSQFMTPGGHESFMKAHAEAATPEERFLAASRHGITWYTED
jgi:hypothetical protein